MTPEYQAAYEALAALVIADAGEAGKPIDPRGQIESYLDDLVDDVCIEVSKRLNL
jgi:hypothetical protein